MSNESRSLSITHSPLSSAVWTGLEPATPCVTGRYSNQLNYHTILDLSVIYHNDFLTFFVQIPFGIFLNRFVYVLFASGFVSLLHCKGKSFFRSVQILRVILTYFCIISHQKKCI